jgi:dTMP kinase
VLDLNQLATGGLLPDRTFLLLIPLEEAASRATGVPDRIEGEGRGFLERVDRAYRDLAELFPDRIVSLDGTLGPDEVARQVRAELRALA